MCALALTGGVGCAIMARHHKSQYVVLVCTIHVDCSCPDCQTPCSAHSVLQHQLVSIQSTLNNASLRLAMWQ
jgi:hypothetical protein